MASTAVGPVLLGTAFIATQHLPDSPLWIAVERVVPAGAVLLLLHPARPCGPWWWRSVALGLCNFGLFFCVQAWCVHRMPGGTVSAITALQTLLVPALAAVTGRRPTRWQVGAALLGVAGVAALVLPHGHVINLAGVVGAASLAIGAAIGMLLTKNWGVPEGVHHLTATAWQMLAGGLLLAPAAALMEGPPPAESLGGVVVSVWLSLGATAAAFGLFFGGLHWGVPAATVSLLALVSPVVSTTLGWLLAGEALTAGQIIGLVAVLAALVLGRPGPLPTIVDGTDSAREGLSAACPAGKQPLPKASIAGQDRRAPRHRAAEWITRHRRPDCPSEGQPCHDQHGALPDP